jgi:biopolymer transport protein ExbB
MAKNFFNKVSVMIVSVFVIVLVISVMQANAWWNEKWQYRKKIGFDTTPMGADIKENLSEFPVLVRLHTGNFDFSKAKNDGSDIRFVNDDDRMPLKHHIEKFDPIDEIALVWVKVPRLSAGSSQNFVWMYYGNESAVESQDAGGTYDVNQVIVYHLKEFEGAPRDETAYGNHGSDFSVGQGLPSVIGNGVTFNGAEDRILIPVSPSLDFSEGFTFSTWIRITQPMDDAYLFSGGDLNDALVVGVDQTKLYCRITGGNRNLVTEKITDLPPQAWHHVAVTAEPNGRLTIYLDGIEMNWMELPCSLPEFAGDMVLGASVEGDHFFSGDLDETKISNKARSGAWIRGAYRSQGPDGLFSSYAKEELNEESGLPVFYLATIFKNITLDGFIIIGILMIFSALSWLIFLNKTLSIRLTEKHDKAFLVPFGDLTDLLALEGGDDFENSSLYRIYLEGCRQLKGGLVNPGSSPEGRTLSPQKMKTFKASLEKAYIRESQKLNAGLVVLTMAVTGGPFLGLLGTVWGVMNTFAAMAEAGEANIMAIAPGVASALSTTVFGLLVAIPALFAYNYLSGKIKNITADMNVFVDEFALRVENCHGGTE